MCACVPRCVLARVWGSAFLDAGTCLGEFVDVLIYAFIYMCVSVLVCVGFQLANNKKMYAILDNPVVHVRVCASVSKCTCVCVPACTSVCVYLCELRTGS